MARLEELTQRQIKFDFAEHQLNKKLMNKKEMCSKDRQFMDSVSQSVMLNMGHYSISLPLKNKYVTFPNSRAVFGVSSGLHKVHERNN